jgi:hypothetical protein
MGKAVAAEKSSRFEILDHPMVQFEMLNVEDPPFPTRPRNPSRDDFESKGSICVPRMDWTSVNHPRA